MKSRYFPGVDLSSLDVRSIPGLISYSDARELQKQLIEERARDQIPNTLLFLEHSPVITRGRGLQRAPGEEAGVRQMPVPALLPTGMEFSESERGGDLTYHGPGQLVIYPIWRIRDIAAFLRGWENLLIDWLQSLGLAEARPVENATGVWVGDRKVASFGIAVRKWVTYHGIAINLVNDLTPFSLISPCGFQPEVMARLKELVPSIDELRDERWRAWTEKSLLDHLSHS